VNLANHALLVARDDDDACELQRHLAFRQSLGLPMTRLKGFSLFKHWRRLSLEEKLRSTLGTARRIITRKLFRPLRLDAEDVHG